MLTILTGMKQKQKLQWAESIINQVKTEFLNDEHRNGFPFDEPSQADSDQDTAKSQWNQTGLDDLCLQTLNGYCCPLCGSSVADTEGVTGSHTATSSGTQSVY
jgi:hypothetical protein